MDKLDFASRLKKVSSSLHGSGVDLLLVTPGADLRYLVGYDALPLERLTCLAVSVSGQSWLIVPKLEMPAAIASGVAQIPVNLLSWEETQNPYELLATEVGAVNVAIANNLMSLEKAKHLGDALGVELELAEEMLSDLRLIKSSPEINALHEAGSAIDRVHSAMGNWLRPGRTEREVGRDIAEAIINEGHVKVDFVIVASGPNGASPHHELSDRVIEIGDPIVVDIGGTMPSGYCSDSTRMYVCGQPAPDFIQKYEILKEAQRLAFEHSTIGVTCESIDTAARNHLGANGLGEFFIHRTGHGIGMDTHEHPYIVQGNQDLVRDGYAFSIEPGFYIPGLYGARIEDIVTCSNGKVTSANNTTHELVIL